MKRKYTKKCKEKENDAKWHKYEKGDIKWIKWIMEKYPKWFNKRKMMQNDTKSKVKCIMTKGKMKRKYTKWCKQKKNNANKRKMMQNDAKAKSESYNDAKQNDGKMD